MTVAKQPASKKAVAKKPAKRKRAATPARDPETGLTVRQRVFADEYLTDLNGARAYRAAGYKGSDNVCAVEAHKLLSNPKVAAYVAAAMEKRSERTEITQDMVLERWWAIATADANDVIQFRRICCRYCYGKNFEYQWVDEAEFTGALIVARLTNEAEKAKKKPGQPIALPTDAGGFGFVRSDPPHPKCPKCRGEGTPDVFAHDTRHLKGNARLLYAGVKVTQSGFEMKVHDQMAALDKVARHLGMYKDRFAMDVTDELVDALQAGNRRVMDASGE